MGYIQSNSSIYSKMLGTETANKWAMFTDYKRKKNKETVKCQRKDKNEAAAQVMSARTFNQPLTTEL